eukprot:12432270-Ditylum_brightwellii.AAC.1
MRTEESAPVREIRSSGGRSTTTMPKRSGKSKRQTPHPFVGTWLDGTPTKDKYGNRIPNPEDEDSDGKPSATTGSGTEDDPLDVSTTPAAPSASPASFRRTTPPPPPAACTTTGTPAAAATPPPAATTCTTTSG